jgi:molybdenum cofactor cytidylyltransferase
MSVAAIILAAGASSRLGEPKQLLQFEHEPLLARSMRLAEAAGATPIFAVVGAHWDRISKELSTYPAIPIVNANWKDGIASSLHAGLDALEARSTDTAGALLMTCDQPHLTAEHLRGLIIQFHEHQSQRIVVSTYAGTVGTPAIFPAAFYPRLRALCGDKGARVVMAEELETLVRVALPRGEIDIDRPEDKMHLA